MKRYLGATERSFWIFDKFSRSGGITIVKITGNMNEQCLRHSLQRIQKLHPLARVRIEEDENGPFFNEQDVPPVPLEILTPKNHSNISEYMDALKREDINTAFDIGKGPFLRVKLIQHPTEHLQYLMVSANHLLIDAHSLLNMTKEILEFHESEFQEPNTKNRPSESLVLRPQLEQLFPLAFTGWQGALNSLRLQWKLFCQKITTRPIKFSEDKYLDFGDRKNAFQKLELDSKVVDTIITTCKENQITVHGFLSAVFMQAVYVDSQQRTTNKSHYIGLSSAVNFRKQLTPPCLNDMGSYVCLNYGFFRVKNQSTWDIAQKVTRDVTLRYTNQEHFCALNMGQWVIPKKRNNTEGTLRIAEKQGPGNLTISNYGRYEFPPTIGSLQILEVDLLPAISVLGNLSSGIIYTLEKLHWYFVYPSTMIEEQRISKIMKDCRTFINQALEQTVHIQPQNSTSNSNTAT